MTDATTESATAGTSGAANGGTDQGSNGAASDPFAGLETGTREWIGTKGYKTVADVAKAAQSAESLIGKSVQLPGPDAKAEDWTKVYRRLGAPEKPDGYTLTLPEGVAENILDAEFGAKFKDAAVKASLTPSQAKAVYDFIATGTAEQLQSNAALQEQAAVKATEGLEKAFGGKVDSEPFKGAIQLVTRAINGLGGDKLAEALKAKGILSSDGAILDDTIAVAFHEIGKRFFTEAGFVSGDSGAGGDNPFKDGPGQGNQTVQMQMIAKDRAGAIRLMRLAGHDPKQWHISEAA